MYGATHECRLVGVFESTDTAQRVLRELVENGFAQEDIRVQASESAALPASSGFWDEVRGFVGDEDVEAYQDAEHRGHSVVVVRTADDADRVHAASEVMRRNDPVRIEGCSRGSAEVGASTGVRVHRPDAVRVYRREIDTHTDAGPERRLDPHESPRRVPLEDVDLGGRSTLRPERPPDVE